MKLPVSVRTRLLGPFAALLVVSTPAVALAASPVFPVPDPDGIAGFVPIFDGKSLAGWDANPKYWRVENGTLVGPPMKIEYRNFLLKTLPAVAPASAK